MPVEVFRGFFQNKGQILDDIAANNLWPLTYISMPCEEHRLHWHETDVHAYILNSSTWFRDGKTGEKLHVSAGDKILIPKCFPHAEGEITEDTTFIAAIPEPRSGVEILRVHFVDEEAG